MFKKEMADKIIAGEKTQTRRLPTNPTNKKGKPARWYKPGSIQPVQTSYMHKAVAHN